MLGKIKNIFSKPTALEEEAADDDFSSLQNPNFLTDPEKIVKLLLDIEANAPLCTIQVENSNENFTSSILGIKLDKNSIMLDELLPKPGNAMLQQCKSLKFLAVHKGIHLSFTLNGVETGFSRGITYYKASLPERIYYPQRRRSHRIEIATLNIPFNGIVQRTGISIGGYLFDLSRDGAGVELSNNRARIQRGDTIKSCQISFEEYVMDFEFSVRFVKQSHIGSPKVKIGGLFGSLSSRSQTKLSYFITSLERVEIRRQKS